MIWVSSFSFKATKRQHWWLHVPLGGTWRGDCWSAQGAADAISICKPRARKHSEGGVRQDCKHGRLLLAACNCQPWSLAISLTQCTGQLQLPPCGRQLACNYD